MIEKLEIKKVLVPNNPALAKNVGMDNESLFYKINELVDAVNELKLSIKPILEERKSGIKVYEEVMSNMKPADPYEEQRKWIGKLCRFWDNSDVDYSLALLTKIIEKEPMPFEDYRGNQWYHCEPVKPDDSIIYKGGDNE